MTLAINQPANERVKYLRIEIQKTRMARDDVERRISKLIKEGDDLAAVKLEDEAIFLTSKIESLNRRLDKEVQ